MNQNTIDHSLIPNYVTHVTKTLENAGFEAFLVGGCVRDMVMGKVPKDWDITTNALPEQIIPLFEKTVYENTFGTVGVCVPRETDTVHSTLSAVHYDILEVTPYRKEGKYEDFRHPNDVRFTNNIEEDLVRRDFTMNALAYSLSSAYKGHSNGQIVDLYGGIQDIKDKTIRAVGNPNDRFNEDALRMLRAVRFSTVLGFTISSETFQAILDNAHLLQHISQERIRDEFIKIIESPTPPIT